jgi:hypothetical protein
MNDWQKLFERVIKERRESTEYTREISPSVI